MAWGVNNNGWWGEGEIKFFMDGDSEFPTICGTGTEDYFCGAYNFENQPGEYREFTTPYAGLPQVIKPDGCTAAAALRPVPLAHHGPDALRAGPEGDHPGAGLAGRFTTWALENPDFRAVIVVGSQARTDHPADALSDLDLILFIRGRKSIKRRWIGSKRWRRFGCAWTAAPREATPNAWCCLPGARKWILFSTKRLTWQGWRSWRSLGKRPQSSSVGRGS
jgi:hypothetical protein